MHFMPLSSEKATWPHSQIYSQSCENKKKSSRPLALPPLLHPLNIYLHFSFSDIWLQWGRRVQTSLIVFLLVTLLHPYGFSLARFHFRFLMFSPNRLETCPWTTCSQYGPSRTNKRTFLAADFDVLHSQFNFVWEKVSLRTQIATSNSLNSALVLFKQDFLLLVYLKHVEIKL